MLPTRAPPSTDDILMEARRNSFSLIASHEVSRNSSRGESFRAAPRLDPHARPPGFHVGSGISRPKLRTSVPAPALMLGDYSREKPFVNSLGMKFVPVPQDSGALRYLGNPGARFPVLCGRHRLRRHGKDVLHRSDSLGNCRAKTWGKQPGSSNRENTRLWCELR